MSRLWSVPCDSLKSVETFPALTTVFTPPSICSTYFTDAGAWAGGETGSGGTYVSRALQDEDNPVWYSCMPKEYDTKQCPSLTFSPGLCPQGWTALGTRYEGTVTTATCCMRGFVFNETDDNGVKSTTAFAVARRPNPEPSPITTTAPVISWDDNTAWVIVSSVVVTTVVDLSPSGLDTESTLVMTLTDPTAAETVTMNDGYLWHSAWVIMWQSSDRSSTIATTTPLGPTELPETDDKHISLSGGAIAGIIVGVLAALGLGVMMGLLIRRRRQRPVEAPGTREQPISVQQGNPGGGFGPEQKSNGPAAPDMAYAVEGGTAVGPSHRQSRAWFGFLGSSGRRNAS